VAGFKVWQLHARHEFGLGQSGERDLSSRVRVWIFSLEIPTMCTNGFSFQNENTVHNEKKGSQAMKEVTSSLLPVVVLVIQADKYDWKSIFAGTKLNCGCLFLFTPIQISKTKGHGRGTK
jgi:hypothetical protein